MVDSARNLRINAVRPINPGGVQQPEPPDLNPQIDQAQQIALDNFQQSVRVVTEGNRNNAALLGNIANNLSGARQAQQLTESVENTRRTGNAAAAINAVGQVAEIWQNLQQQRAQRRRDEALVQLAGDKERFLAEAEGIIRNPQQGRQAYDRLARGFISQYAGVLDVEGIIELTADLYDPYRRLSSEEAQSTFGTFEQIYDQNVSSQIAGAEIRIAGQLARLGSAATVEDTQAITEEAIRVIDEQVIALGRNNPRMALAVSTNMLEQIGNQYGDRLGQLAEVTNRLNNLQQYYRELTERVTPLINQGQYQQAQQLEALLAANFDVNTADRQQDPLAAMQLEDRYRGYINNQQQFAQSRRDRVISEAQFSRAAVRSLAFRIATDPTSVELFEPAFQNNPYFRQARALAETFVRYRENASQLQLDQTRLQRAIDTLNRQDASTILSNLENPDPNTDELLIALGIASQFDSGLDSIIQRYQQGRQIVDPEQRQRFIQEMLDANANIRNSLARELQIRQSQLEPDMNLLRQYEIYSPEDFEALAAGDDAFLEEYQTTIRDANNTAQESYGVLPNFSLPGLSTTELETGAQAILPLMESTNPHVFTGAVGDDRDTHIHAGLDIAIRNNEEIVFYTQGVVEEVKTQSDGYGLYVDIRSPDGHLHRFAHLNDSHVSVGQTVVPGEVIGRGGSTGRSTGPHLHWEIRRPGGARYGYDPNTVMNPLEYTSQFSTRPRQQRVYNGPTGGREMPDTYASTVKDDYQPNNSDHNFGYSQLAEDAAFRNGLHRVANSVFIPTMWLADVIAFESNFQAGQWNIGGAPAVGLIQFYADPGTGGRFGTKRMGGVTYQMQDISQMSRIEQLELVQAYLEENRPNDGYQSPYELLATIFGGRGLLNTLRRDPARAMQVGDGDITFGGYTRELGSHAGRQYQPIIPEPIRTR